MNRLSGRDDLASKQQLGLPSRLRHMCDVIQKNDIHDTMFDELILSKKEKYFRYILKFVSCCFVWNIDTSALKPSCEVYTII